MVWTQAPEATGALEAQVEPEPERAQPGEVYYRHWKWFAVRALASVAVALVGLVVVVALVGDAFRVLAAIMIVVGFIVAMYGFYVTWKVVTLEVAIDKLTYTHGLIRTGRISVPTAAIQGYEQLYRHDFDRLVFHCVELRLSSAAEEDGRIDFYPMRANEATKLIRYLDRGRRERPSDPMVRLQRQSLEVMQSLVALLIVHAERLGAQQEVIERVLELAAQGESPAAISRYVFLSKQWM